MKKAYIYIAIIITSILFSFYSNSQGSSVYVASIEDDIINPIMAEYIDHAVKEAEVNNAECLIIKLDTPGGLLTSTRKIVKSIMNSKIPIVVYVSPSGARAGSAGVFITLAANIAAMAPSTNIGAAHPVYLNEEGRGVGGFKETIDKLLKNKNEDKEDKRVEEAKEKASPMDDKILNDTKAWVKSIAELRNRNVNLAVDAVEKSISVTENEALSSKMIDLIAFDVDDLLHKINGWKVNVEGKEKELKTENVTVVDIAPTLRSKILSVLAHPNITYILLMLGFYGLLFEFTHPGIGFSGVVGVICLIIAFYSMQVLPTNYAGVALIVVAIILFIAEIKVTSYGLLTLGGISAFLSGSLILFDSPHKFMQISISLIVAFGIATFLIAFLLLSLAIKAKRSKRLVGTEILVGKKAEVILADGNRGKIFIDGEIWNVNSEKDLEKGQVVEVLEVKGMSLLVK